MPPKRTTSTQSIIKRPNDFGTLSRRRSTPTRLADNHGFDRVTNSTHFNVVRQRDFFGGIECGVCGQLFVVVCGRPPGNDHIFVLDLNAQAPNHPTGSQSNAAFNSLGNRLWRQKTGAGRQIHLFSSVNVIAIHNASEKPPGHFPRLASVDRFAEKIGHQNPPQDIPIALRAGNAIGAGW